MAEIELSALIRQCLDRRIQTHLHETVGLKAIGDARKFISTPLLSHFWFAVSSGWISPRWRA